MKKSSLPSIPPAPWGLSLGGTGIYTVLILFLLLFFAGCTEDNTPSTEVPPPPGVLVDYQRTGGIAGVSDHIVVFSDGQVVYSTRQGSGAYILSPGDLDILRGLIRDADIPSLKDEYPAPQPGADYFAYTLVVGNRMITTETTGIPEPLSPVIITLDGLISNR